jgi:hypothetical protein
MKRVLLTSVLFLAALGAFAIPGFDPVYFPAEMKAIRSDLGAKTLGDLKVDDLVPIAERLDVARQKDLYLMTASGASFLWPGAGQFMAGDWTGGALQTSFHVGISAGTLYWAHSLLPSDLRWGNLDYLGSNQDTINARWKAHSFGDYLPALGALAAGGVVDFALRAWSARDARTTAQAKVDAGAITFEPRFEGGLGFGGRGFGMGGFGLGMGMRY